MGKKKYDSYGARGRGACHKVFSKIKAESFQKHIQLEEFHRTNLTLTFRLMQSQGINAREICMKVTKINQLYRAPLQRIEEQM